MSGESATPHGICAKQHLDNACSKRTIDRDGCGGLQSYHGRRAVTWAATEGLMNRIAQLTEAKAAARRRVEDLLASPDNSMDIVRGIMEELATFARVAAALAKAEAAVAIMADPVGVPHIVSAGMGQN